MPRQRTASSAPEVGEASGAALVGEGRPLVVIG